MLKTLSFPWRIPLFLGLMLALLMTIDSGRADESGGDLEAFHRRFIFVRENGQLTQIKDNFFASAPFRLRPWLTYIKEQISQEQKKMSLAAQDYDKSVQMMFADPVTGADNTPDYLLESLHQLQGIDVEYVFSHPEFQKVVTHLEDKINVEMAKLGLVTLASPGDAKYFYTRNVTYFIVKSVLEFAAQRLGEIPVLNTAVFVIKEAERLFRERRTFHQNMLMHYLEKFPVEQLGLTKEERQLIWSSIYESRIAWFAFWESDMAVGNWQRYGANMFSQNMSLATQRLQQNRRNYDALGKRLNYGFQEATLKGQRVILNLFDTQHQFSQQQAIAHYYDRPMKVMQTRQLLQLGQLGLSFITIPQFIKDLANNFMKSYYERQRLSEGALIGHFESTKDAGMRRHFLRQNVNPFEWVNELGEE